MNSHRCPVCHYRLGGGKCPNEKCRNYGKGSSKPNSAKPQSKKNVDDSTDTQSDD